MGKSVGKTHESEAAVRLLIEDAAGETLAQRLILYDEQLDLTGGKPVAQSITPDAPVRVVPGRYWIAAAEYDAPPQSVTLTAGETRDVTIKIDRSVWLTFLESEKPVKYERRLLVLRPEEEIRRNLAWRRGSRTSAAPALRRPEATDEDLEAARKLAQAALPEILRKARPEKGKFRFVPMEERSNEEAVERILSVAGKPEDAAAILSMASAAPDRRWYLLKIAGFIEARHERLADGALVQMAAGANEVHSGEAAQILSDLGLPIERERLLHMATSGDWGLRYLSMGLLAGDQDAKTLQMMRTIVTGALAAEKRKEYDTGRVSFAALSLLTHGNANDWKLLGKLRIPYWELGDFIGVAANPRVFVKTPPFTSGIETRDIPGYLLDRPPGEVLPMQRALNDATANEWREFYRRTAPAVDADKEYAGILNQLVVLQSRWLPHADAVRFYGGFRGHERLRPTDSDDWNSVCSHLRWLPWPECVDLYVRQWFAEDLFYRSQLEYVDITKLEEAVQRLGGGKKPPGYDLYMAYKRIAHRQECSYSAPMGERRWPYVLTYREKDPAGKEVAGGGISGVSSLQAGFRGKTLVLRVKLAQDVHYENYDPKVKRKPRTDASEWPHNRYVLENGRQLIGSVVVRRGAQPFAATDTGRVEDGWFLFESALDSASLADLWVDIDLKFLDQTVTLTEALWAGELARLIRLERRGEEMVRVAPASP
ncbi:MAG: hypothetical protein ACKV19_03700 [Verrucomicrobiales bacterium]